MYYVQALEPDPVSDPVANRAENEARAVRRAKRNLNRYAVGNRLNQLVSLTFSPAHGHYTNDLDDVRRKFALFLVRFRKVAGRIPWVMVVEHHKSGALHVHIACRKAGFISKASMQWAWPYGHVDFSKRPKLPSGRALYRHAAAYLGKYLGKELAVAPGRHRYEVAQGFEPMQLRTSPVLTYRQAVALLMELAGGEVPSEVWDSTTNPSWRGPPVTLYTWG